MAHFGYHYNMRWWCVLILFAYIIFVRVTSILALKYCESQRGAGFGFTRFLVRDHPRIIPTRFMVDVFCSRIHGEACATLVQLVLRSGFCKPLDGVRLAHRSPLTLFLQAIRRRAVGSPLAPHPLSAPLSQGTS